MADLPTAALSRTRVPLPRRLVAVGVVRRTPGRTLVLTATAAGVSGRIVKAVTR